MANAMILEYGAQNAGSNMIIDMIGEKLRRARHDKQLSLQAVASQAHISAATLSRIETNKQSIDLSLLLVLCGLLDQRPSDLFEEEQDQENESIVRRLAALDSEARTVVWRKLAAAIRAARSGRKGGPQQIGAEVEELLAQIDVLGAEIEALARGRSSRYGS